MTRLKPFPGKVKHGSDLQSVLKASARPRSDWLDLSAAVSPYSWWDERGQRIQFPADVHHHLPESLSETSLFLQQAINDYYQASKGFESLAVAGTQAAIRNLPQCFEISSVWTVAGSYGEHALAWRQHGHAVTELPLQEIRHRLSKGEAPDVLVIVNPDNPSGVVVPSEELKRWTAVLSRQGGMLVCDEAFMDVTPDDSLLRCDFADNQIVLRSLGKFFGLAGLRFGTVFGASEVIQQLDACMGPWTVSTYVALVAAHALQDRDWQEEQRVRLASCSRLFEASLPESFDLVGATSLFVTVKPDNAVLLQRYLAEHCIWSRCFEQQNLIRFGLPREADLDRVRAALQGYR